MTAILISRDGFIKVMEDVQRDSPVIYCIDFSTSPDIANHTVEVKTKKFYRTGVGRDYILFEE